MKFLLLSGSLRQGAYSTAIVNTLASMVKDCVVQDISLLPFFNPDLDKHTLEVDNSPKEVLDFRKRVRESDVFIIATPEYAHQMPGVLKNALDWLVSSDVIVNKSTVVISSSTSAMGGAKAHTQLVALLNVISQNVLEESSLIVSRANKKIDAQGNVIDESLKKELEALIESLDVGTKQVIKEVIDDSKDIECKKEPLIMPETKQEYAKKSFDAVASKYDEIECFKISAKHVAEIIKKHTRKTDLKILDVACGTGNVVLECASRMEDASFDAVDISEGMLTQAKKNASSQNLDNIDFFLQDVTKLDLDKKYNVITCAYALFFLPNAPRVLASLVKLLKRKGIIIFTSFTAKAFSPSSEILLALLKKYASPRAIEYDSDSWKNLKEEKDIGRLCMLALVNDMKIQTKEIRYGLSIDQWWELCNNTGFKGMLMELSREGYESVRTEYYEAMFKHADMDGEVELIADTHFVVVS